jgi:hypothetical protein
MEKPNRLDAAILRRLAVRASTCEQTIRRVYEGLPVRGLAYYRAQKVLEEFGLLPSSPGAGGGRPKLKVLSTTNTDEKASSP